MTVENISWWNLNVADLAGVEPPTSWSPVGRHSTELPGPALWTVIICFTLIRIRILVCKQFKRTSKLSKTVICFSEFLAKETKGNKHVQWASVFRRFIRGYKFIYERENKRQGKSMRHTVRKRTFGYVRHAKIQISLLILNSQECTVASCGQRKLWHHEKSYTFHRGGSNESPQSMILSRNKKNNVYPCKPQFYYIKVRFRGVKIIKV